MQSNNSCDSCLLGPLESTTNDELVCLDCGTSSKKTSNKNFQWLRKNKDLYKGNWVALKDGELLGWSSSRLVLHRKLSQGDSMNGSLFVKVG